MVIPWQFPGITRAQGPQNHLKNFGKILGNWKVGETVLHLEKFVLVMRI